MLSAELPFIELFVLVFEIMKEILSDNVTPKVSFELSVLNFCKTWTDFEMIFQNQNNHQFNLDLATLTLAVHTPYAPFKDQDQCVNANQVTLENLLTANLNVWRVLIVPWTRLVSTKSVTILVQELVEQMLCAKLSITIPFALVHQDSLEIHLSTAKTFQVSPVLIFYHLTNNWPRFFIKWIIVTNFMAIFNTV